MTKSLADMLADSGPAPLPKASIVVTLVQGQHILDELQEIQDEFTDLVRTGGQPVNTEGERMGPPLKAGQRGPRDQVEALRKKSDDAYRRLAEYQVTLGLTGTDGGVWQAWKDAHPPRPGVPSDTHVTRGWCNAADLLEDLDKYVTSWDGDDILPSQWNKLAEKVTYADRRDICTKVVDMFETGVAKVPFSLSGSSTTKDSATD